MNKNNNSHYRDCGAITDNLSHFLFKLIRRSLEFLLCKNRDDRFCLTPAAASLQRHSEPQAKNPEKIILDNWILRFAPAPLRMTMSVLAFILSLNLSTTFAATSGCDCGSTANGGSISDCCWKIEGGVLTIYPNPNRSSTGNVTMKDFGDTESSANAINGYTSGYASTAPWARQNVTSVVVEGGINNIGAKAFIGDTKITSVDMPNVTSIGEAVFNRAFSLNSINMPNVTSINQGAFYDAINLSNVNMPNITSIGYNAFALTWALSNIIISDAIDTKGWDSSNIGYFASAANIRCLGDIDICKEKLSEHGTKIQDKVQPATESQCNSSENYYSTDDGCIRLPNMQENCATEGFSWVNNTCSKLSPVTYCANRKALLQENVCVSSCGANYKLDNGICHRVRYTPAEAAQVAGESNTIFLYYK